MSASEHINKALAMNETARDRNKHVRKYLSKHGRFQNVVGN